MVKVHYGTPDASGLAEIIGYYPDTEKYSSIPEPCIEVNNAVHMDCYTNPGRRKVNVLNQCIVEHTPPEPIVTKAQKIASLNAEYFPQLKQIDAVAISAKVIDNDIDLFDTIMADKTKLHQEYTAKLGVLKNG